MAGQVGLEPRSRLRIPAQQLKREQSLASCFSRADASCHGISNTWFACGFPSSSLTWPATQWVSMHPFCLGLATTSARAALRLKAGRQPLCQRPSHAPHFWRAVFHSNVSRLQCQQSHTLSVRCRAARGRQPSWRSPRAYRVEWPTLTELLKAAGNRTKIVMNMINKEPERHEIEACCHGMRPGRCAATTPIASSKHSPATATSRGAMTSFAKSLRRRSTLTKGSARRRRVPQTVRRDRCRGSPPVG